MSDALVSSIARSVGIADGYVDAYGERIDTRLESKRLILDAFGFPVETEAQTRESAERVGLLRDAVVPPLITIEANRPARIPLRSKDGSANAAWRLADEGGAVREGRSALSGGRPGLDVGSLDPGYHRLTVTVGAQSTEALVIAAPPRCWQPRNFAGDARLWGTTAQIYGLVSPRNLGIGDFTDVGDAAVGCATLGASFLGLSPVHALFSADRSKISPYSPSSRLFLEPLHIDVTALPGFAESGAAAMLEEEGMQAAVRQAKGANLVEHAAVWAAKSRLLEQVYGHFREHGDRTGLTAFGRERGEALWAHAGFEALHEHFWGQGKYWLGEWPEEYRDPRSARAHRFQDEHRERIAYHAWLQWEADRQLRRAHARARAAGMGLGLYRDLAVGADRGGSEVWAGAERFAPTLAVGAPPDMYSTQGQNWGLPPFNPLTLEREGLAAFRAMVRANTRHAGAIRIDHAFQLQRLYLIAEGHSAREGAYVDYPFEAMLAVLKVESHLARCVVIAEDLGNGPEGFSDAMMAAGILSYRVLPFERGEAGRFKQPAEYPRQALAVIGTHDWPTFRGWWRGLDIDLRQTLGLYDGAGADREREARAQERRQLAQALVEEHLLPTAEPPEEPPLEAVTRYLARMDSVLTGMQFEDASGELNQANLPGIGEGHPNWRRKLSVDVASLVAPGGELAKLAAALAEEGRGTRPGRSPLASPPPRATYRLQFHENFTFEHAQAIVPYLARLGISHIYASPILQARPGSTHGYDIVNHEAMNPELGGEEAFRRFAEAAKAHGLGLILDIVPNHMGVGGSDNGWWLQMLEWGELSPTARYFDIDWGRLGAGGKVVIPFLGSRYGEALEAGELKLSFDADEASFSVWHWEHRMPVCPLQYPMILERAVFAMADGGEEGPRAEAFAVSEALRAMDEEDAPERRATFVAEGQALKARLKAAVEASPTLRAGIERAVTLLNGTPGVPESVGTLHRILEMQAYRLAYWRVAASDINYRRFFDINSLAGLRIEEPELFEKAHALVFGFVREGLVQGLRIDHIDGLADPEAYTRQLQQAVGPGFYVLVEKILEPGERLRHWPVAGTTGYEALNLLDGVFVDPGAGTAMDRVYREFTDMEGRYHGLLRDAKAEVLSLSFSSELEVLGSDLKRIADADRATRDFTVYALRRALVEIVARFPTYRTYIDANGPSAEDRELLDATVRKAKRTSELPDRAVHDFIRAALLGEVETDAPGRPPAADIVRFRTRFQQLTGPVMAKSLEDTLFYRYARLISLNEVGGDPGHFGVEPDEFHDANRDRAAEWPHALIATATHDTKRGEDARARLNALSEMPSAWGEALDRWRDLVEPLLDEVEGEIAPDANDQYMIFQALLGAWPVELLGEGDDPAMVESFRERMDAYVTKALREAKRHTSWVHVREPYEAAALGLVRALLEGGFLETFRPLARRLAGLGAVTSLSRTVLKCTVPGVPDIYQGTEMWDLSLVDPDNRRPVDYEARARTLEGEEDLGSLLAGWQDGRIKAAVLARLLADRTRRPALYAEGDYVPLAASGAGAEHVLAFMRTLGDERIVVVAPRLLARLGDGQTMGIGEAWGDTRLTLPAGAWRDVITGGNVQSETQNESASLALATVFSTLPVAVLTSERGSGSAS